MKETGIIMSGDHPLKCLDGTKTTTRRVIIPQPIIPEGYDKPYIGGDGYLAVTSRPFKGWYWVTDEKNRKIICPYGGVGDRLWVRETHQIASFDGEFNYRYEEEGGEGIPIKVVYRADYISSSYPGLIEYIFGKGHSWRPSIHMPRWASRILLEITEIRAERLQEITEEDARAEGIDHRFCFRRIEIERKNGVVISGYLNGAKARYSILWDSLNAKRGYGWETNPWVWVIGFILLSARLK